MEQLKQFTFEFCFARVQRMDEGEREREKNRALPPPFRTCRRSRLLRLPDVFLISILFVSTEWRRLGKMFTMRHDTNGS